MNGIHEVTGSIPVRSTILPDRLIWRDINRDGLPVSKNTRGCTGARGVLLQPRALSRAIAAR